MSGAGYVRRAKRVVYENPWLRFEAHEMMHPNGRRGEHGVVVTPRASAVVLVDGDDVLLARQARFAVDRIVLEVIKGGRHAGKDGLACAQRESREEAGVAAARWNALGARTRFPRSCRRPVAVPRHGLSAAPLPPEAGRAHRGRADAVRRRARGCAGGDHDAITALALLRAQRVLKKKKKSAAMRSADRR